MFTELEWRIMQKVWDSQPTTSREIVQSVTNSMGTSAATIKTMLHRLVEKQAMNFQRKGNRYLYWANLSRAEATSQACRELMDVVFDGQAAKMICYLSESCDLSFHQAQYLGELMADIQDACLTSQNRNQSEMVGNVSGVLESDSIQSSRLSSE